MLKRHIFIIVLISALCLNAQQQEPVKLEPIVVAGDLVFIYNALNTIEIKGNEVEAFMAVKKSIETYVLRIQNEKMTQDDSLKMVISLGAANNLLAFMERMSLKGGDAEKYLRFRSALVESAETLQAPKN